MGPHSGSPPQRESVEPAPAARAYKVRRDARAWVITLAPEVRKWLGVTARGVRALYWHRYRRGEVVLSADVGRKGGRPDTARVLDELAEAHQEIARLVQQRESLERARYAEGYSVGYQAAMAKLADPIGPSARRQSRRRGRYYADQARGSPR